MNREEFWRDHLLNDNIIDEDTFKQAMQYAFDGSPKVIIRSNEVDPEQYQYAIVVKGTEFWMDAFETQDEAVAICEKMWWVYECK